MGVRAFVLVYASLCLCLCVCVCVCVWLCVCVCVALRACLSAQPMIAKIPATRFIVVRRIYSRGQGWGGGVGIHAKMGRHMHTAGEYRATDAVVNDSGLNPTPRTGLVSASGEWNMLK